ICTLMIKHILMKTSTFLFLFLFLSSLFTVQAQEKIYDFGPFSYTNRTVVYFNGKVHVAMHSRHKTQSGVITPSISSILVFDDEGNLEKEVKKDSSWTSTYTAYFAMIADTDNQNLITTLFQI